MVSPVTAPLVLICFTITGPAIQQVPVLSVNIWLKELLMYFFLVFNLKTT